MSSTTTSCGCYLCRSRRDESLRSSEFNPPQVPVTRLPALGVLLKARMLALIQDETARVPGGGPAWEALLHLRETVEDMEILL